MVTIWATRPLRRDPYFGQFFPCLCRCSSHVGVSTRADAALRPALRPVPLLQQGSKHRTFPQKATKATKEEWLNRSKGRLRAGLSRTVSKGNKSPRRALKTSPLFLDLDQLLNSSNSRSSIHCSTARSGATSSGKSGSLRKTTSMFNRFS
jgi:hypothetical protein